MTRDFRDRNRKARVDMTPLVDVIFTLLLFFMMTSVFKVVPGLSMQLPSSTTSSSVSLTQFRVVARSESEIYVNDTRTSVEGLDAAIKREMGTKKPSEIRAVFQSDKSVPYQLVISVLDALRINGIEGVSLLTQPNPGQGKKKP
jgi:biopolymer transport protein ExbD